ncbi:MAG: arginine N-succinyltransferase [Planctomycetota bacterium]
MLVVRNVCEDDIESLFELIQQSEFGLTTLKIERDKLRSRIENSVFGFGRDVKRPGGEPYVFVMEDMASGQIVGTSAIYSKVGGYEPFYTYVIKPSIHESKELDIRKEVQVLHLCEEHDGPSEIGSLFLSPDYWGHGHGRTLSLARFLYMAEFPERFESEVIAEMRGVVDSDGKSPLWAALGSHFFQIGLPKADTLTSKSKKFIADLMPRHPIYIPLLPEEAREVIGKVHRNTEPAMAVLKSEGFAFRDRVDIFDGGPALHCDVAEIRSVRQSRRGSVGSVEDSVAESEDVLISNALGDFRCCRGRVSWDEQDGTAVIDRVTSLQLNLKVGSPIRTTPVKAAG